MPYEISKGRLLKLVMQALSDHELNTKINDIAKEKGFTPDGLKERISDQFMASLDESTVWRAASPHIDDIRGLEAELDKAERLMPEDPSQSQTWLMNWPEPFLIFSVLLAFSLTLVAVVYGIFIGWSALTNRLSSSIVLLGIFIVWAALVILAIIFVIISKLRYRREMEPYNQLSKQASSIINEVKIKIESSKKAADNAVIESGIKAVLREIVNEYLERSYKLTLEMLNYEGLAEVRNEKYDIPTESYQQMSQLVRNMRGGSIGLAGPRGSGKTTLMYSFCQMQTLENKQRQVLSVMASAPVNYENRDFIILIFKLVCKRLLSFVGEEESTPWNDMDQELNQSQYKSIGILREVSHLFGRWGALLMHSVGAGLIAVGFTIGLMMPMPDSNNRPISQTIPAVTPLATTSNQQPTSQMTSVTTPSASPDTEAAGLLRFANLNNLLEQLGITAPNLIWWGFILISISWAVFAIRRRLRAEWARKEWEKRTKQERRERSPDEWQWEKRESHWEERRSARQWLKDLRFQQSFSSGWSGSLNLPVGLDTGVETTIELAQNQLSLPEIINGYQKFVRDLTKDYTIIIGIDELDKIGTAEEAYNFLNGIKALFGIDDCFYLAVSSLKCNGTG